MRSGALCTPLLLYFVIGRNAHRFEDNLKISHSASKKRISIKPEFGERVYATAEILAETGFVYTIGQNSL